MTALAEKMKAEGVDTIGARLTVACAEAIRRYPESATDAWWHVGVIFGHEFVLGLMNDMQGPRPQESLIVRNARAQSIVDPAPYKPRVIPPERLEKRRELQHIVRSKFKTSDGRHWSDITPHEAASMSFDGSVAAALLAALPVGTPNDGRHFGELLGVKRIDEIAAKARK